MKPNFSLLTQGLSGPHKYNTSAIQEFFSRIAVVLHLCGPLYARQRNARLNGIATLVSAAVVSIDVIVSAAHTSPVFITTAKPTAGNHMVSAVLRVDTYDCDA